MENGDKFERIRRRNKEVGIQVTVDWAWEKVEKWSDLGGAERYPGGKISKM